MIYLTIPSFISIIAQLGEGKGARAPGAMPSLGGADLTFTINILNEHMPALWKGRVQKVVLLREHVL